MTEWEEALARVESINEVGRKCPRCRKGRRQLVRQSLEKGIDRTVWKCSECSEITYLYATVNIPS